MKIYSTYSVKIVGRNRIFRETAAAYRSAVDFFIDVSLKEWGSISRLKGLRRNNQVERYTIKTQVPQLPPPCCHCRSPGQVCILHDRSGAA